MNFSTSFRQCLKTIYSKRSCEVSRRLLQFNRESKIDYLALRGTNISFLPEGKPHIISPNGKWDRKGRQEAKPGRVAKAILGSSITDKDAENFNNYIKAYVSLNGDEDGAGKAEMTFVRVYGELIYYYYSKDSHAEDDGNLGGSCMRHDDMQTGKVFELYSTNPNCSLLVLKDQDYRNIGRALLWVDGENTYMDTVYSISDVMREKFIEYAIDNGWFYKSSQSCHHHFYDMFNGEKIEPKPISFPIKFDRSWNLPYIDTVYKVVYKDRKYFLQNFIVDENLVDGSYYSARTQSVTKWNPNRITLTDIASEKEIVDEQVQRFNGTWVEDYDDVSESDHDGEVWSDYHGEWIDDDDACYLDYTRPNGRRLDTYASTDSCTYIESGDYWVLDDDAVFIDDTAYILSDENIVVSITGEYRLKDECKYDDVSEEWYHENDMNQCRITGEYHLPYNLTLLSDGTYIHKYKLEEFLEDNPQLSVKDLQVG